MTDQLTTSTVARSSTASPQAVRSFIDAAFAAFETAASCCAAGARSAADHGDGDNDGDNEGDMDIAVAGRAVRVRFAGPGLRSRFVSALRHLTAGPARPDLTICCWDGSASPVALPPPPWTAHDFVKDSRIRGHIAGPVVATYDRDGRLFQLYDRVSRRALFHVADGTTVPDWHDRAPFRPFLSLWADDHRLALLHGATVAERGSAVVLAGGSGAGKSTTAVTCALAGLDFLGDDACLVDAAAASVHSVFGRAKVEPDAVRRLGGLHAIGAQHVDERGGTVLSPRRVLAGARLHAVLLVGIGAAADSALSSALPADEALAALLPTVREENRGLTPATCDALAAVVAAVPVRRLTVGCDPAGVVRAVRRALG